mmetsp:Transcript_74570/g.207232  ORF Transcript_74570/g.207232 Transcript_74570/m.207232 type:complete len:247 (+) Transcript_74570:1666-2406(+)
MRARGVACGRAHGISAQRNFSIMHTSGEIRRDTVLEARYGCAHCGGMVFRGREALNAPLGTDLSGLGPRAGAAYSGARLGVRLRDDRCRADSRHLNGCIGLSDCGLCPRIGGLRLHAGFEHARARGHFRFDVGLPAPPLAVDALWAQGIDVCAGREASHLPGLALASRRLQPEPPLRQLLQLLGPRDAPALQAGASLLEAHAPPRCLSVLLGQSSLDAGLAGSILGNLWWHKVCAVRAEGRLARVL